MSKETRHFQITELRVADEGGEKRLKGHAAVFNSDSVDLGGFIEQVAPGAFKRSIDSAKRGETNIHAFWNHDSGIPLGSKRGGKLVLREDEKGLAFDLSAKRLTDAQLDAVQDGDMQMSFGFRTLKDSWEKRNGKAFRTLLDVDLFEISLVSQPAYPDTKVALRSLEEAQLEDEAPEVIEEPKIESDTTPVEDLARKLSLSMQ